MFFYLFGAVINLVCNLRLLSRLSFLLSFITTLLLWALQGEK